METTTINKSEARRLFPIAPDWMKTKLEKDFGKEIFSPNLIDRIRSLQDAYDEVDDATRRQYDRDHGYDLSDDILADIEAKLIAKALQGDWQADFDNKQQKKWSQWFIWSAGSGFGFSGSGYYFVHTDANVGSRFCFKDEKTSDHFGRHFIEIHRRRLTPQK